ncbi:uncharacterized protein PAC_04695 [Phialocephala subalpina]|uniref:Uncharacterized protein n=1 Tax=Phialocephala subalpina TaxID=576137 RepID=A0A1L7WPY9_9HELO|nr:uncharacterized protein PAC_04695 [Phialocephala subalpina]
MAKEDDEDNEASPSTPAKRKVSNNINNGAKRTPVRGPRSPSQNVRKTSAQKNATPIRKPSANANKTPNSAPARARGGLKKTEPTLLGDFLLGRPSPARKNATVKARRKSLDAVKAEMKAGNVQQVQQPGKVQERVRQWQKSNAKAGEPEHEKDLDEIVVEYETDSDIEPVRPARRKSRTPEPRRMTEDLPSSPRPGRRKDQDEPKERDEKPRSKSVAPKKRVISDEHWMKNRRRSPPGKGRTIPKNFLQTTAINPPVERKIEDWVKRMTDPEPPSRVETPKRKVRRAESEESESTPTRSRKVSRHSPREDGIRIKPSKDRPSDGGQSTPSKLSAGDDGIRIRPSRSPSPYDGIRIKPSKDRPRDSGCTPCTHSSGKDGTRNTPDDGIRIRPSDEGSVTSEIQVKKSRDGSSRRRPKDENDTPTPTPRKKSQHLAPPTESESRSRKSSHTTTVHDDYATTAQDDDATSYMSPTPSKRRNRKSDVTESLDEIPFGNSAFSVLDLPLGAEAGTMKRPEPKRNHSFNAVPKVLKRVYTEGMKRVHDPEPPRGGPNQPPSIEKWLNGTTDPFIERPATADASSPVPEPPVSRMRSFKEDDRTEHELTAEHNQKQKRHTPKPEKPEYSPSSPLRHENNRETLPSMGKSPPISPLGLKRSPATRITSSPKSGKKFSLKEAVFDAFKGESAMAKTAIPTPFDFIGQHGPGTEPSDASTLDNISEYVPPKISPRTQEQAKFEDVPRKSSKPVSSYPRRPPPVAGGHSLSTIASVTSYSNSSSATETDTGSELSQTTVTQDTVLSGTTGSSLSRKSTKSRSKREGQGDQSGLKRSLTKHADLVSMLSLPDTTQPGRSQSIRSARSIRTTRVHLEDATVEDLLREVVQDESKYMRELNTLVDGVIPVLLTCVLSKSDSAVAAGLFEPLAYSSPDATRSFTKPIVDMGVALERLKSLHKRIPLTDPDSFLHWASQTTKIYEDYLRAWRTGFEDVVVNLAPASRKASLSGELDLDTMPTNEQGEVVGHHGEHVDVAHLLKAPMRRIKNLARIVKGLIMKRPTITAQEVLEAIEKVNEYRKVRVREEQGRKEDLKACLTDTTRAFDPKTMESAQGITIDRSRQVTMKDVFQFDMSHSSGQRMELEVELTFREARLQKESDTRDPGDILISGTNVGKSYLLFPPIITTNISARKGDTDNELVVMIRGGEENNEWGELLVLEADEKEVRDEWLSVLPAAPFPGIVVRKTMQLDPETSSMISTAGVDVKSVVGTLKKKIPEQAPIGERLRREYEKSAQITRPDSPELPPMESYGPMTTVMKKLGRKTVKLLSDDDVYELKDLNDAMAKAGHKKLRRFKPDPNPSTSPKSQWVITDAQLDAILMSGALPIIEQEPESKEVKMEEERADYREKDALGSIHIPKRRIASTTTPLKENMRPDSAVLLNSRPTTPSRDDGAPPPPVHRSPVTPPTLKNIPVIDSVTPKAGHRRGSSPLKHEYQPSSTSGASSETESVSDDDSYSESDDSLDELEEAEMDDIAGSLPAQSLIYGTRKVSPPASIYSLPNGSVAPLDSASQAPYPEGPSQSATDDTHKFNAMVTYWNHKKGSWDPVHLDPCTIKVGPGWIETFEIDSPHALYKDADASTNSLVTPEAAVKNPLIYQELTPSPYIQVRQSNAVDVQVKSTINERSRFKKSDHIQYRLLNDMDCHRLFMAVKWSRDNNPVFIHLSEQRRINDFGSNIVGNQAAKSSGSRWLFRKKSFRRKTGQLSDIGEGASTPPSSGSFSSPLKRFSGGGIFNIGKSSVSRVLGGSSAGTSSSGFSGVSPPDTPGGSQAPSFSMQSSGRVMRDIGTNNLPIILYSRAGGNWITHGQAFLTISDPQPHQRQSSTLNHGPTRHVLVALKPGKKGPEMGRVIIDDVLGADSFSKGGNTGIYVTIWRDVMDENGNVGVMPRYGGLSGKTEKWCFQTSRAGDCQWIYMMLRSGRD